MFLMQHKNRNGRKVSKTNGSDGKKTSKYANEKGQNNKLLHITKQIINKLLLLRKRWRKVSKVKYLIKK